MATILLNDNNVNSWIFGGFNKYIAVDDEQHGSVAQKQAILGYLFRFAVTWEDCNGKQHWVFSVTSCYVSFLGISCFLHHLGVLVWQ